ncbi:MAG: hypothetical protein KBT09_10135 [Bacteroidales bacterium]|nr:hypothetical protein [Candidatus Sodaliphilus fimicaballi]
MKKLNRTTLLPTALLVYLAVMAYLGYPHLQAGETLFYFGVIGASLVIIALLYIILRKRDKIRQQRDEKIRETYEKDEDKEKP